jgi:hypothetical protein
MVRHMQIPLLVIFSIMCIESPLPVLAQLHEPLPSQSLSVSFDEVDDATLQAEVSKQAMAFLHTVQDHWGQTPTALRAAVAGDIREDEQNKLIFLRNIAEHGVLEGYEFRQESLVRGQYILLQRPLNGLNEFIGYYQVLKRTLTESYGTPVQDRILWNNDLYQPLPDYWGVAVMIGHLQYHAAWETDKGTLTLELTGDHHCKLMLEYQSYRAGAQT